MTDEDEREFLTFLRTIAPIQLLGYTAPTKELIWMDEFAPRHQGHWKYLIWNQAFPWQAEYSTVLKNAVVRKRKGWFYLSNTSVAPVTTARSLLKVISSSFLVRQRITVRQGFV